MNFVSTAFRRDLHRVTTTIVLGVVGSVLAAAGILGHFTDFLIVLGVAFPPIAGIMVAEYFVVKQWRGDLTRRGRTAPCPRRRRASCRPRSWSGRSPLPSATSPRGASRASPRWCLSVVLYVVAGKLGLVRSVGVANTRTVEVLPESQPVH